LACSHFVPCDRISTEHGHCDVPQRDPALGHFVKRLRKEYEAEKRGLKSMNEEKKRLLNDLGFTWRVRVVRGSRRRTQSLRNDSDEEEEEEDSDDEPVRHYGGRETLVSPQVGSNDHFADQGASASPGDVNHFANQGASASPGDVNHFPGQGGSASPGDSNHCSMCLGTIIYASAQCVSCRGSYCQGCFDQIREEKQQQCQSSSCSGRVNSLTGGWAI